MPSCFYSLSRRIDSFLLHYFRSYFSSQYLQR
jgi:hypothetical protein